MTHGQRTAGLRADLNGLERALERNARSQDQPGGDRAYLRSEWVALASAWLVLVGRWYALTGELRLPGEALRALLYPPPPQGERGQPS